MKSIILIIKSIFIGIANAIPGVSGGTLAIIMGIYQKMIDSINNLFKAFKKNFWFLFRIAIGMGIGVVLAALVLDYTFEHYLLITIMFFTGLIIGGIPKVTENIKEEKMNGKHVLAFLIPFLLVVGLAFVPVTSDSNQEFLDVDFLMMTKIFLIGIIAAGTMIIPGVSGSLILMVLGVYYPLLSVVTSLTDIGNLLNFSFLLKQMKVLVPMALGVVAGIFLISKPIGWLFRKHKVIGYYIVLGFLFSSILGIFIKNFNDITNTFVWWHLLVGIVFLVGGVVASYYLAKLKIDDEDSSKKTEESTE